MSICLRLFFASCALLIFYSSCSFGQKVNYDRYRLLEVTPTTEYQLDAVYALHKRFKDELDFWLHTPTTDQSAYVTVKPTIYREFTDQLDFLKMPYKLLLDDIGQEIASDRVSKEERKKLGFFEVYRTMDEIYEFITNLTKKYPNCASLVNIGTSFEDRPLRVIRISTDPEQLKHKPMVWIQSGMHAREQIGPAVATYLASKIAALCRKRGATRKLIQKFDWYILPILNPDGYEYAQNYDRLWRKTRSRQIFTKCVGVDPNRNFGFQFGDENNGSSSEPCSNNYAGYRPLSEPETRAVVVYMTNIVRDRMELFLDFHSFSQKWLTPYGYTITLPQHYEEQVYLARIATKAIQKYNGTKYTIGTSSHSLYPVNGGARDWAYHVMLGTHSYVVELPDQGQYGFILPRRFIYPTAAETWVGVRAMALELIDLMSMDGYSSD
ncbi:carboxypeptidase A2 [Caerostris extrusa]|uniref:Carboxypeptidase A2 n=1 Tax=Caerostris extrusa TaxID=172846 RepID=A0AAV4PMP5_CAEEX|nr:carboxypeptidase A2 [Caerostris extrusa]